MINPPSALHSVHDADRSMSAAMKKPTSMMMIVMMDLSGGRKRCRAARAWPALRLACAVLDDATHPGAEVESVFSRAP
jgi:hypothetical protein